MLDRYCFPEMKALWAPDQRFAKMLEVEIAIAEAWAELGAFDPKIAQGIKAKAAFSLERIEELEKTTRHDVVAFLECVGEKLTPEEKNYLHYGITSYDVVDTGISLLLRDSARLILKDLDGFLATLKQLAKTHKTTLMAGRTHGMLAEPISLGLKFLLWHTEFLRHKERLELAEKQISAGKISGPVGTYATVPRELEKIVCAKLGLTPAPVSSQILQRDRHGFFLQVLALLGSSLEKIALEIRLLQINERNELAEGFFAGQKGSSAMPHKQNPVISEKICGLSRILRGNAVTALENIPLWDERDISHSSAERIIFPQSCTLSDYLLRTTDTLLKELRIHPENMRSNLEKAYGTVFSQRLMFALTEKGMAKEEAYKTAQSLAFKAFSEKIQLRELVEKDPQLAPKFTKLELDELFDFNWFLRRIPEIYRELEV